MILTFFFNRPNILIGVRKRREGREREGTTIKRKEKKREREIEKREVMRDRNKWIKKKR